MKRAVARSWISARLSFLLKLVKRVERPVRVTKAGLLVASLQEPILAAKQFVLHQVRDEIDRGAPLGLRLPEARFQGRRHAGQAQLTKGVIEFDEVHMP